MRRIWIAITAALGFGIAFIATAFVGIWQSEGCDGVCVDKFPLIGLYALASGVLGALAGAFAATTALKRYFAKPS